MWVVGTPWSLRVCSIVFSSNVHVVLILDFLVKPSQPTLFTPTLMPLNHDLREVLLPFIWFTAKLNGLSVPFMLAGLFSVNRFY